MKVRNTDSFTVVKIDTVNISVGIAQPFRSSANSRDYHIVSKLENRNNPEDGGNMSLRNFSTDPRNCSRCHDPLAQRRSL
jgi:hypothetical protein